MIADVPLIIAITASTTDLVIKSRRIDRISELQCNGQHVRLRLSALALIESLRGCLDSLVGCFISKNSSFAYPRHTI